jgi:hypothetical protein
MLYVELGGNGVSFQNVWSVSLPAAYTQYTLDLSALALDKGIALDEDVYVRFRHHSGYGYVAYLDDVRITAGLDLFGPRVLSRVPGTVEAGGGPLSRITVTFDEPIDVASFTEEDVSLRDPRGVAIAPVAVTPVGGSGDTQFDLDFAAQDLRGTYRLTVGPQVLDLSGNPMNQNGNAVNGEAADAYSSTVVFRQTVWTDIGAEPELYVEGFEEAAWDGGAPSHWSLIPNGNGTVTAVTSGTPQSGTRHLRFLGNSSSSYLSQYATLAVDLSSMASRDDVMLSFWARRETSSTMLYVELGGNGVSFQNVWSVSLPAAYTQYTLDLSALALDKGIALDEDVYVRFRHHSGYGYVAYLDDVRITAGLDLFGPRVLSRVPGTVEAGGGPLSRITVTFDEPIDVASFTEEDVSLRDPRGVAIAPVAVTPVGGSGDTQFDLDFAAQDLRGTYRLTVGPQVLDLSGNPMNQNGNAVNGEAADAYSSTVVFRQTVWTDIGAEPELYVESFEEAAWDGGAPSHWSLIHNGNGTVTAVTSGTPQSGTRHLRFLGNSSSSYLSQYATLAVDLSSMASRDDVMLSFWARRETSSTMLYVELGGNGVSFQNVWSVSLPAAYTQYTLDLSALALDKGIALDEDVYVRFRHHSGYGYVAYLDDVRITAGLDLFGPRVLSRVPGTVEAGGGPLSRITVTFDEPIDVASFTEEDVNLRDPRGVAIAPVAVTPVGDSGDTQFDLDFAAQDLRGTYRLTVGPQILDLSGNPMNQNGNAVNGEAADAYSSTVVFRQTVWTDIGAEPELYVEGFEEAAWDGGAPSHWSLIHNGNGTVTAVTSGTPQSGTRHLRFKSDSGSSSTSQYATLAVDLSSMASRDDVMLSFWARRETSSTMLYVELGGNGVSFQNVWSVSLPAAYTQYTLDLSALALDKGIALDEDVYVRFRHHSGYGYVAYLDDVRITAGLDLFGPRVLSRVPGTVEAGGGPLSRITVTFDEPIDVASFTEEDVSLRDPRGVAIAPVAVTPVGGSGDTQFDLDFAAQDLRGTYRLTVGPQVLDLSGNPMNQNGNAVNGEAADAYSSTVVFRQTVWTDIGAEPDLYVEGFEEAAWDGGAPSHWSLIPNGNGTVTAVTSGTPQSGTRHLRFLGNSSSSYLSQYATLAVDLSSMASRDDVMLSFWARRETSSTMLYVELGGNGVSFQNVWSVSLPAAYTQYTLDLSALALDKGIALDEDVYVRFRHHSGYGYVAYLDDVRITAGLDLFGPRVLSRVPGTVEAGGGPLSRITVTFDEPIDVASFTEEDVSLRDPRGVAIAPVAVTPVGGSGDTQFDLDFAAQDLRGTYRLTVGPQVLDLSGNPMNQNGNAVNGEAADAYSSTVVFRQTVWTDIGAEPELYVEGFEEAAWDGGAPSHWSLIPNGNGTVTAVTSGTPQSGTRHLRFLGNSSSSYLSQYATLAVDLSSMASRDDVMLSFWARRETSSTMLYVELGGNGVSFQNVWSVSLPAAYTQYTLDLSALALDKGIALDEDVYVRFRHHSGYGYVAYLDDVRITAGLDLFGPRVLSRVPGTVEAGGGPLSRITVTFDEPIDVASFTEEDVNLRDPRGVAIAPVAVTPVGDSGDTQFDLDFAAQDLRGTYRLTVGPQILDLSGNPMNQNGNAVNGEAADAYSSTVVFRQTVWTDIGAEPELYVEGFEEAAWDGGAPSHWSLIHNGNGTVTAVTSGTPQSGTRHLRFKSDSGSSSTSQYATLAVDLSSMASRDDVMLSFWARRETSSTMLYVELGGNGVSFQNVWSVSLPAAYTQYTLDLSALALDKGIALDEDVYVRFRHHSGYGYVAYLDDVRITAGLDLFGPRVLSRVPGTVEAGGGPLSRITVTFDEPIDVASFTEEDVSLRDPRGVAIAPVAVTPVGGSGDTQFDLDFAAQDLRGTYRLTVGPQVLDLSGNPMNQNGNAVNGEAADAYSSTVVFRQTVWTDIGAEPELYVEGFEEAAWDGGAPSHWSLIPNGNGTVTAVTSGTPQSGTRHLRFLGNSSSSYLSQYATLAVDLSSMASRDDVMLSFWARRETSSTMLYVELGGNGVSFQNVWSVSLPAAYTQYTLDLSALALDKGIALDEDVYVRFRHHSGYGYVAYLDDVRITAGLDLFGPRVLSSVPGTVEAGGGPLSTIRLTFDEPIAVASFTAEDVVLKDAQGNVIEPVTVTPVVASGDTQFDLTFGAQDLRGVYRLSVGPEITDLAGNLMNQNGNAINGEAADAYAGTVRFAATVWSPPPGPEPTPRFQVLYEEPFEDFWPVPTHWAFETMRDGTIGVTTAATPQAGTQHLEFRTRGSVPTQSAVLAVDLTGYETADDLFLTFWAKQAGTSGTLYMDLSGNGISWQNVATFSGTSGLPAAYTNFTLDLDSLAADKGVARDEDFYVRFRSYSSSSSANHFLYLDDVRIVAGDLMGPRVVSQSPVSLTAGGGPLSAIRLTFDEPIEVASFTAEDVVLKDAQGNVIEPVTVTPVVASGDTQFDLTFGAQDLRGVYRLSVGPEITDLAGNLMNQNGNAINGEAADAYAGTVRFAATVWSPPPGPEPTPRFQVLYEEPFEDFWPVPTHWAFETMRDGTIGVTTAATRQAGTQHLEFRTRGSVPTQSAVLAVDLTGYETADDLFLTFWAKQAGTSGTLYVDLSGNGTSWQNVATFSGTSGLPAAYTNFTLDLDSLAADKGIARDEDFYVRFRSYSSSSSANHLLYLDDVRIVAGDLMGPMVVGHWPLEPIDGPVTSFTVTFDEPIGDFPLEEARLWGPLGNAILPTAVTSSDALTWTVTFPSQELAGRYQFKVGPGIRDVQGNLMNQDRDAINGETNGHDEYNGQFFLNYQPLPASYPYFQGFEDATELDDHWYFRSGTGGRIQIVADSGDRVLRIDSIGSSTHATSEAVFAIDLAGQTGVKLFWNEYNPADEMDATDGVFVSSDQGATWFRIDPLSGKNPNWQSRVIDLDAAIQTAQIDYSHDFRIKFQVRTNSTWTSDGRQFDDIRVTWEGDGPKVVGTEVSGSIVAPFTLDGLTFTFDKEIDASTFTLADVISFTGPDNTDLTGQLTGVSGSGTTFTVHFVEQTAPGAYTMTIGPYILDLAGNPMDQNSNGLVGETHADRYTARTILLQPVAYPYYQGFDGLSGLEDLSENWAFIGNSTHSRIQLIDEGSDRVLRVDSTGSTSVYVTNEAIFAIDLAGRSDVKLFLLERNQNDPVDATDGVWLSDDRGLTWYRADPLGGTGSNWQNRVVDLDAAIAAGELAYTNNFLIKLQHYGRNAWTSGGRQWDDIRVTWEGDGPKVVGTEVSGSIVAPFTLDGLTFTFDKEIDASTFTLADVISFTGPDNADLTGRLTRVSGSGTTFTVHFAEQTAPGAYTMSIGPYILDLAGNPMDQNSNGLVGETFADRYTARTILLQPVAYPYYQGFDGLSGLEDLSENWAFIGNSTHSRIQLIDEGSDRVLRVDSTGSTSVYVTNEAIFAIDLTGRSDVKLFLLERNQSDPVDATDGVWLSDDRGLTWYRADPLGGTNSNWQNRVVDLDAAIAAGELAYTDNFLIKLQHYGRNAWSSGGRQWDDIRVTWEGDGPKVVGTAVSGSAVAPFTLDGLTFTFDKAIDASTFTLADVISFTGPDNTDLTGQLTGVSGSGTTFTVHFAEQTAPGAYTMSIGPYILDLAGNPMDQNSNGLVGETYADRYTARTILLQPVAYPYYQGFDGLSGLEDLSENWAFIGNSTHSRIQLIDEGSDRVLRVDSTGSTSVYVTNEAIFAIDLTGRSDVKLFLLERNQSDPVDATDGVWLSDDRGLTWYRADPLGGTGSTWQNRVVDLDAAIAAGNLNYTNNFLIKLQHYGRNAWTSGGRQWDDIRVTWEGDGPKVVGTEVSGSIVAPFTLDGLTFTFDKAIDASTFTLADVISFTGPDNTDLTGQLTGVTGSGTTFTVHFAEQTAPGAYTMRIGPYILDLAGNPMDQNSNGLVGETIADRYTARTILLQPVAYPYYQGFDGLSGLEDLSENWAFIGNSTHSRIQLVDDTGDRVLRVDSASSSSSIYVTNEAIFAIDLAGRSDVKLFLLERNQSDPVDAADGVWLSDDRGLSWFRADPLGGTNSNWQNRTVDLDAAIAAGGLAYTNNFLIKLQHYGRYGWTSGGRQWDDIRVTWEGDGAKVVGTAVSGSAVAPFTLDGLTFTFDKAIDASTFTLADVISFTGPDNTDLTGQLTGVTGSGTTFTVHFAEQTAPGAYTMRIGPYILDLAGNPMDQNGNGLVGETIADRYTARTILLQPVAYPYYQGFDGLSGLEDLSENWAFIGNSTHSRIQLVDDTGDRVLRVDSASSSSSIYVTNEAVFAIDLAGRSDVKLFLLERNQSDPVDATDGVWLSDDRGLSWYRADTLGGTSNDWQSRVVDLDAAILAGNLNYTNNFLIKLQHYGRYGWTLGGRQWDDIRVTWEGDGPKVVDTAVSGSMVAPFTLDGLTFTFDKAIDASTFTLADVISFTGPDNADLTGQLTGVTGSGTTFTVHFAEQTAPGAYTMRIGPYILDLAGNPMDQNGNGLVGETIADRYTARTILLQPVAYPYYQGFDGLSGLEDLSENWAFIGNSTHSRIQLINDAGDRVLRVDSASSSSSVYVTNEAIFAIDLAGRSDVKLFLLEQNRSDPVDATDGVWLSDDRGLSWYRADTLGGTSNDWQSRVVDLDAAILAGNLSYTNNFLIKLQHSGRYGWTLGGRQWDDIRVTWEGDGPRVLAAAPAAGFSEWPYSLSGITFTFSEPIDPASFTIDDVVAFTGPDGTLKPLVTGVSGSGTTYTVHFAEQTVNGRYTMVIGPYILDLAANPMDQDGNGLPGETVADRYAFTLGTRYYVNDSDTAQDVWSTAPGDNSNNGLTPATPKATVQAILAAYDLQPGDEIRVDVGTYLLASDIVLGAADGGNATAHVMIRGVPGKTILDRGSSGSVFHLSGQHYTVEGMVLRNGDYGVRTSSNGFGPLLMRNNIFEGQKQYGFFLHRGDATLLNNTFYAAGAHGLYGGSSNLTVRNNIFHVSGAEKYAVQLVNVWADPLVYRHDYDYNDYFVTDDAAVGYYLAPRTDLSAWQAAIGKDAHSISVNPLFADPAGGDFHLKSQGGRYEPATGTWVIDSVHSPAIDAGDPASPFANEPAPHGGRINMGAYGNTAQASKADTLPMLLEMTIVHAPSTTDVNGQVVALPANEPWVHEWQSFWVEIWVSTPDSTALGVAEAQVNLQYHRRLPDGSGDRLWSGMGASGDRDRRRGELRHASRLDGADRRRR